MPAHPYQSLTPDVVADALSGIGLHPDGRLFALGSYENRVYQAALDPPHGGHPVVVAKFYRPGRWSAAQVLEEHAFAAELVAAEVPVVAPLCIGGQTLHTHDDFLFSVSPRRGGRAPEADDLDQLEWIGRFIARLHTVGESRPFAHRPALDIDSFGHEPMQWLLEHEAVAPEVRSEWAACCHDAIQTIAACAATVGSGADFDHAIRVHGDTHRGNILWTPGDGPGAGPHFVDLDDCRMAPAVQDLWMLLDGDRAQRRRQLAALLEGYEQMRPLDPRELTLIEPLRTLRLLHYSAWLARRWSDPAFPAAFPWFGTGDYWRDQVVLLREQIEAMHAPVQV